MASQWKTVKINFFCNLLKCISLYMWKFNSVTLFPTREPQSWVSKCLGHPVHGAIFNIKWHLYLAWTSQEPQLHSSSYDSWGHAFRVFTVWWARERYTRNAKIFEMPRKTTPEASKLGAKLEENRLDKLTKPYAGTSACTREGERERGGEQ